jgi:hypothetical protein
MARTCAGTQCAAIAATPGIAQAEKMPNAARQANKPSREWTRAVAAKDNDHAARHANNNLLSFAFAVKHVVQPKGSCQIEPFRSTRGAIWHHTPKTDMGSLTARLHICLKATLQAADPQHSQQAWQSARCPSVGQFYGHCGVVVCSCPQ